MIGEFGQKRAYVTFNGGRFVCSFQKKRKGLSKNTLIMVVFEVDSNYQPVSNQPIHIAEATLDKDTIFTTLKLIKSIDDGVALWLPPRYKENINTALARQVEEEACAMALGLADHYIKQNDSSSALLNIKASLLSNYIMSHRDQESKLIKFQASAFAQAGNFDEAKKSYLNALKIESGTTSLDYYILAGYSNKLNDEVGMKNNLKSCIQAAKQEIDETTDPKVIATLQDTISHATRLIND